MIGAIQRLSPCFIRFQSAAALGARGLATRVNEVEEINREMADVFGVPFAPPEGTCLGPSSNALDQGFVPSTPGPWNSSTQPPSAPFSQAASQQEPLPASLELLQELRQSRQLLEAQVQYMQQLLQGSRSQPAPQPAAVHGPGSGGHAALPSSGWDNNWAGAQGSTAWRPPPPAAGADCSSTGVAGQQQQEQAFAQLSHVDASGTASMVDVAGKASSGRVAQASCRVYLGEEAFRQVAANKLKKGDVLSVARIAGIQGAKATSQLIPLCHNIFISSVNLDLQLVESCHAVDIRATAKCVGQTGVEMEALTGAAVAALTVYDMAKAVSKGIRITDLQLQSKEGGKSGVWRREA